MKVQSSGSDPVLAQLQSVVSQEDLDWYTQGTAPPRVRTMAKELKDFASLRSGGGKTLSPSDLSKLREYFNALGQDLGFVGFKSTKQQYDKFLGFLDELNAKHGWKPGVSEGKGDKVELSAADFASLRGLVEGAAGENNVKRQLLEHSYEKKPDFSKQTGNPMTTHMPQAKAAPTASQISARELVDLKIGPRPLKG